jgi:hypothetical protein
VSFGNWTQRAELGAGYPVARRLAGGGVIATWSIGSASSGNP